MISFYYNYHRLSPPPPPPYFWLYCKKSSGYRNCLKRQTFLNKCIYVKPRLEITSPIEGFFSSGLLKVHVHAFHFFSFLLSFKFSDYVSKVVCVTFIIIITAQFCLELNIFFIMKPNKKHATNMYIKMFCI